MNVRFEYLYRDAGNFKNWCEVVFANPRNICADRVAAMAEKALRIDSLYFVASEVNVPDLHFAELRELEITKVPLFVIVERPVIASEARQSIVDDAQSWIAALRSQ